ncbi:hypothetical protein Poly30_20080 [Planctomycetes bacterium Poly30]|uniref:LTD domain-containing protein n=1 Tax=Saltatorellus ferox TaxID=2528018 RepID=A0A518EQY0_9BACT|nr:hypothetical protein Poly30_20080 [Planctomycetes bacterium Poly30]
MKNLLALGLALSAASTGQALALQGAGNPILLINEIRIDEPGTDVEEYFELLSIPSNVSLDGYTYLVIGDGSGGSGVIESVSDLTGGITGADGLFVGGTSNVTLTVPDLVLTLQFENSDNVTHLLVQGFTGANGDDLDTDDDGVLDVMPWTSVVDAVSLVENTDTPTSGEFYYGASLGFNDVGPDGTFVPSHVFRCLTSLSDWRIGLFDVAGGSDTPGMFNANCNGTGSVFCDPGVANEVSATGGKITYAGSLSFQRNDTTLIATDVPNNFGLFIQSDTMMPAAAAQVGGNLCLGGTLVRLNQILLASNNAVSLQLDVQHMGLNEFGTIAGSTVFYQYYFRDSATAGGGNFSNGLMATWTL